MAGGTRTDPVLITGCSSGIGRAAAVSLHHAGLRVYTTARRVDMLADLASRDIATMALDVTGGPSMTAAVAAREAGHRQGHHPGGHRPAAAHALSDQPGRQGCGDHEPAAAGPHAPSFATCLPVVNHGCVLIGGSPLPCPRRGGERHGPVGVETLIVDV